MTRPENGILKAAVFLAALFAAALPSFARIDRQAPPARGDQKSKSGRYRHFSTPRTIQDPNPQNLSGEVGVYLDYAETYCWVIGNGDSLVDATGTINSAGKCNASGSGVIFGTVPIQGVYSLTLTFDANGVPVYTGSYTLTGQPFSGNFTNIYDFTGMQVFNFGQAPNTLAFDTPDPVSTATGEFHANYYPDISLGGPLPLLFQRCYSSYFAWNGVTSSLGLNWMHNYEEKLAINGPTATVLMFRGGTVQFHQNGGAWTLSSAGRLPYQLVASGNGFKFFHPGANLIYTFSSTGDLTAIEDRNGNVLTVTPSAVGPTQVSDGLGRTLTFTYNASKLVKVQDQTGRSISFTNDGTNLTDIVDANGGTTLYSYTSVHGIAGLMTSTTRPGGNKPYTQTFDALGRVSQQTDSFGGKSTFTYNSGGTPGTTLLSDALSRTTTYFYPNLTELSSVTDPAGKSASMSYDPAARLKSRTDRLGNTSTVTYDSVSGFPASRTDAAGNVVTFTYTSQAQGAFTTSNVTEVTYPDGTTSNLTYDSAGNILTATNRAGKVTTFTYNSRGQVLTVNNAAGGIKTNTYNADGTLATSKTPAGDVTTYTYDTQKRQTKVQYADSSAVSLTWSALDQLLTSTDERGKVTKFAFDANSNLKSVTDALNQSDALVFDTDDLLTSLTERTGKQDGFQYNVVGSMSAVTNPAGEKTTFAYDSLERLKSAADPAGKGPSFNYDAEGRLVSSADALANASALTVDQLGRTTRSTSPLSENTDLTYDSMSRVTAVTNPLSQKTTYSYEPRGNLAGISLPAGINASYSWGDLPVLTRITDPNGNAWTMAYDTFGRPTSVTDPLGQATTTAYDARDRVSSVANAVQSVQITYDAAGNPTKTQYSDSTTLNFTFDDDNRVTGANGVTLAYDANGRISASNGLTIQRDDAGRILSIVYPGGTVTYTYNSRGLLATVSDWVGGVTSFTYDDDRRMLSLTRPNGVVTQYTYDKNSRIASIVDARDGTTVASATLQRDAAGQVISADRVPAVGTLPAGVLPLAYDAASQLSGGATSDAFGRLSQDALRTYTWDGASRLTSYTGADGSGSFQYDAFGLRIARTGASGPAVNHVVNYATSLPSVAVLKSGGSDVWYYVYLPDGSLLHAIKASDKSRRFYSFDEMGTTTVLTDDAGAVADRYAITPYGETVTHTGTTDNPFTFEGRWGVMQEPGTSLFYMRFRYYDSASARFLSRDPFPSLDPRQINPYQYAAGNPLVLMDPMGLKPQPPLFPLVPANSPAPGTPPAPIRPPGGTPLPPYTPLVITEAILQNEQAAAKKDFDSRWWNPTTIIDFDSPTFHGNQYRPAIVNGKGVSVQNQVIFEGRLMDYGEFNYYYTSTYYTHLGLPRGVQVVGTYAYNLISKGQWPTENQIIASNAGSWDAQSRNSWSGHAPVTRVTIDLTPAKNVLGSIADTVGNFIIDHPTLNAVLSWLDN